MTHDVIGVMVSFEGKCCHGHRHGVLGGEEHRRHRCAVIAMVRIACFYLLERKICYGFAFSCCRLLTLAELHPELP